MRSAFRSSTALGNPALAHSGAPAAGAGAAAAPAMLPRRRAAVAVAASSAAGEPRAPKRADKWAFHQALQEVRFKALASLDSRHIPLPGRARLGRKDCSLRAIE